MFLYLIVEKL